MAGTWDMWGMADYAPLGERLAPAGRRLIEVVAPTPGERVLDMRAGRRRGRVPGRDRAALTGPRVATWLATTF